MKRYSIDSLYVVNVIWNYQDYYFICKKSEFLDNYIEVLSKGKINPIDISKVEPLKNYYSIIEQCNYIKGSALMLSKTDLITKYIDINNYHTNKKANDTKTYAKQKKY